MRESESENERFEQVRTKCVGRRVKGACHLVPCVESIALSGRVPRIMALRAVEPRARQSLVSFQKQGNQVGAADQREMRLMDGIVAEERKRLFRLSPRASWTVFLSPHLQRTRDRELSVSAAHNHEAAPWADCGRSFKWAWRAAGKNNRWHHGVLCELKAQGVCEPICGMDAHAGRQGKESRRVELVGSTRTCSG